MALTSFPPCPHDERPLLADLYHRNSDFGMNFGLRPCRMLFLTPAISVYVADCQLLQQVPSCVSIYTSVRTIAAWCGV